MRKSATSRRHPSYRQNIQRHATIASQVLDNVFQEDDGLSECKLVPASAFERLLISVEVAYLTTPVPRYRYANCAMTYSYGGSHTPGAFSASLDRPSDLAILKMIIPSW